MRVAQVSSTPPSHPPQDWLEQQYALLQQQLIRYAIRQLHGDHEAAKDVVQDAFAKLCSQPWPEIQDHCRAWLYRVCRNKAIDLQRSEGRMSQSTQPMANVAEIQDTGRASVESQLDQAEAMELVRNQISRLSKNQQEVLRLRLQENLSYREIAEVTGLSVSNVGFQLHEAICSLRSFCKSTVAPPGQASKQII
jgi:RNA polymerase sigma-70 factor (ECF subfamily)